MRYPWSFSLHHTARRAVNRGDSALEPHNPEQPHPHFLCPRTLHSKYTTKSAQTILPHRKLSVSGESRKLSSPKRERKRAQNPSHIKEKHYPVRAHWSTIPRPITYGIALHRSALKRMHGTSWCNCLNLKFFNSRAGQAFSSAIYRYQKKIARKKTERTCARTS